ncbi:MAG: alcohol dehydrogenase catalytic domain-containing protein [Planctomycetes bacterium]|nr:alcohol dehydrogenase catalytic domain-containing protein [Planctomycetota bacterium]
MRGLYIDRGNLTLRDDLPEPEAGDGWSRVRVLRAGICATDQALGRGYMGFAGVPGHEFVGMALDGPLAGRRVVGEINAGCGSCAPCSHGDSRHCERRTVLGIAGLQGAFAERLALPNDNLFAVPDGVDDDAATFTEPLAAALHIGDDVDLAAHPRALVAGDGKLGLLCAGALALRGCEVTLAGRHPERAGLLGVPVEFAAGWLEPDGDDGPAAAFDLAVEATGDADVLPRLLRLVRPRGTIVLKTTSERPTAIDLSALVVDEQRLIGSRCGRFEAALDVLAHKRLDVRPLVSARYDLEDAGAAFAHAGRRGTLKVLLDVGRQ